MTATKIYLKPDNLKRAQRDTRTGLERRRPRRLYAWFPNRRTCRESASREEPRSKPATGRRSGECRLSRRRAGLRAGWKTGVTRTRLLGRPALAWYRCQI